MRSYMAVIRTCKLNLGSGFVFELNNVFYIPEFSRNLIYVSRLVPLGYSINFNASGFDLLFKSTWLEYTMLVRSDRGGEFYGKYTENGQAPGPFAKFLQEHGIVAQYTMLGSPN